MAHPGHGRFEALYENLGPLNIVLLANDRFKISTHPNMSVMIIISIIHSIEYQNGISWWIPCLQLYIQEQGNVFSHQRVAGLITKI